MTNFFCISSGTHYTSSLAAQVEGKQRFSNLSSGSWPYRGLSAYGFRKWDCGGTFRWPRKHARLISRLYLELSGKAAPSPSPREAKLSTGSPLYILSLSLPFCGGPNSYCNGFHTAIFVFQCQKVVISENVSAAKLSQACVESHFVPRSANSQSACAGCSSSHGHETWGGVSVGNTSSICFPMLETL